MCNHGLRVKVAKDTRYSTRLNLDFFDFDVLDCIDDDTEKLWVIRAINDFVVKFTVDVNLKEALDEYKYYPFDDLLMLTVESIIQNKINDYENVNGMAFSKLLGIHIANYVHGCALELESGRIN
ncbi:hypothetical protein BCB4_0273 [Bacillus phage B4]|nr:hypothetical protein BCB4_0273 [Bacillus phage B4]AEZ66066.1 hypothetical protein BCB4_0273 [Bacillus phage B4]